jgi:hypothetical protein
MKQNTPSVAKFKNTRKIEKQRATRRSSRDAGVSDSDPVARSGGGAWGHCRSTGAGAISWICVVPECDNPREQQHPVGASRSSSTLGPHRHIASDTASGGRRGPLQQGVCGAYNNPPVFFNQNPEDDDLAPSVGETTLLQPSIPPLFLHPAPTFNSSSISFRVL